MPGLPIERGLPGPGLIAHVLVAKYCDHTPLHRQSGIYAREGVELDRSTLAEMARRMVEKGLLSRERTEEDQRANAVAISASGRKALRSARLAAERAERALLDALPASERAKFVKALAQIASAADAHAMNGGAKPRTKAGRRKRG